jgi:hypothetical protein
VADGAVPRRRLLVHHEERVGVEALNVLAVDGADGSLDASECELRRVVSGCCAEERDEDAQDPSARVHTQ